MKKLSIGLLASLLLASTAHAATLSVDNTGACSDVSGTPYCSIQAAINDAVAGDIVQVADGIYPESLDISTPITLQGQSRAGTIIDMSAIADYGIWTNTDDLTLESFTLIGPTVLAFGYGIKAEDLNNLVIRDVTVEKSGRSEIDLNGVDGALISDVTASDGVPGNKGVGIAMTDSNDITIEDVTTSGNPRGGIAIYTYGVYFPPAASDNVSIINHTFDETVGLYSQEAAPGQVTNVTAPDYVCTVISTAIVPYTRYFTSEAAANAFAAGLPPTVVITCDNDSDNDSDNDGVDDEFDMCPDTVADTATPGPKQWVFDGVDRVSFIKGASVTADFTIADTHGCSCEQIVDLLPGKKKGHTKKGCSKGIIQKFIQD